MKDLTQSPLRRTALKDRVAELIREAILAGKLESGDRIVESALANDLGVGTTAVREALFALESQGFVTRIANKGTFVTEFSEEDLAQIYWFRGQLEFLAIELLERQARKIDLSDLDRLVERIREAAGRGDVAGFYRADLEFHRKLWHLAGNRYLAKSLEAIVVPLFAFYIMKLRGRSVEDMQAAAGFHADIVTCLREGRNSRESLANSFPYLHQYHLSLFNQAQDGVSPKTLG